MIDIHIWWEYNNSLYDENHLNRSGLKNKLLNRSGLKNKLFYRSVLFVCYKKLFEKITKS